LSIGKIFYSKYNKGGEYEDRAIKNLENNKEKRLLRQKKYREENVDKIKETLKIYGLKIVKD